MLIPFDKVPKLKAAVISLSYFFYRVWDLNFTWLSEVNGLKSKAAKWLMSNNKLILK